MPVTIFPHLRNTALPLLILFDSERLAALQVRIARDYVSHSSLRLIMESYVARLQQYVNLTIDNPAYGQIDRPSFRRYLHTPCVVLGKATTLIATT